VSKLAKWFRMEFEIRGELFWRLVMLPRIAGSARGHDVIGRIAATSADWDCVLATEPASLPATVGATVIKVIEDGIPFRDGKGMRQAELSRAIYRGVVVHLFTMRAEPGTIVGLKPRLVDHVIRATVSLLPGAAAIGSGPALLKLPDMGTLLAPSLALIARMLRKMSGLINRSVAGDTKASGFMVARPMASPTDEARRRPFSIPSRETGGTQSVAIIPTHSSTPCTLDDPSPSHVYRPCKYSTIAGEA